MMELVIFLVWAGTYIGFWVMYFLARHWEKGYRVTRDLLNDEIDANNRLHQQFQFLHNAKICQCENCICNKPNTNIDYRKGLN